MAATTRSLHGAEEKHQLPQAVVGVGWEPGSSSVSPRLAAELVDSYLLFSELLEFQINDRISILYLRYRELEGGEWNTKVF